MKGDSLLEVNIGLVMQWHFVGLDTVKPSGGIHQSDNVEPPSIHPIVQPVAQTVVSPSNCVDLCQKINNPPTGVHSSNLVGDNESDDLAIEDKAFEEGDECARQITGGPSSSMMSIENPEAFAEVVCLAPGEGQRPLYIMTDTTFETMSNPDKFPFGAGSFSDERPRKISYQKYFNQRLLNVDGRFASDTDYLFTAQYIVEAKKILDDCNHFIFRQKPGNVTAAQAKDQSFVSQCVRKDKAYRFMKNIRGSPPYIPTYL